MYKGVADFPYQKKCEKMAASASAVLGGVSILQLSKSRDAKTKCSTVVAVSGFPRSITSWSSPNHPRLSVCQTASSFSKFRYGDWCIF